MNYEVLKLSKFPERGQKKYSHAILRKVAYFYVSCGPSQQFLKVSALCSLLQAK